MTAPISIDEVSKFLVLMGPHAADWLLRRADPDMVRLWVHQKMDKDSFICHTTVVDGSKTIEMLMEELQEKSSTAPSVEWKDEVALRPIASNEKRNIETRFLSCPKGTTEKELRKRAKFLGFRQTTVTELYAFGAQNKGEYTNRSVMALGSSCTDERCLKLYPLIHNGDKPIIGKNRLTYGMDIQILVVRE